jgi:hypothetical protein
MRFTTAPPQLRQRARQLLVVGRPAVPAHLVLELAHPFALDGAGHDGGGPIPARPRLGKGAEQGFDVVAVDLQGVPAKGGELLRHRLDAHDLRDAAFELQIVLIDHGAEVGGLVVRGAHRRLPDLPLLDLAVTEDGIDAGRLLLVPQRQRHAVGDRQALSQGAGGGLDARATAGVGVALQDAADLAQPVEIALGDIAAVLEDRVERRRGVPLGQYQAVAARPVRLHRVVSHLAEVEADQDLST